jgi:formylglycine-generating enzyme required for sulfatase activity/uncharacterized caspase-like protein
MRFIIALIALLHFALPSPAARADTRVALIIGNGAYQHLPALKNPPNDARALADSLRDLGFDVDLGVDLALADMQRKVTGFAKRAQAADVALAFFAGHGVQAQDPLGSANPVNYLLPVDADVKEEADLGFQLTARDILARLQAAGSVRILILDACRDNPIPQRLARGRSAGFPRGLSPEPKTGGLLIAYSTQPGTIADDGDAGNSPFMTALLAHIADPGLDIRLLFADVRREVIKRSNGTQTPETADSLEGRFSFRSETAVAAAPEAAPAAGQGSGPGALATSAGPAQDEVVWTILKDTSEAEALRRFIAMYPSSPRRADADARLKVLEHDNAPLKGGGPDDHGQQAHGQDARVPRGPDAGATPPAAADEAAWTIVKDTREAEALRRFVAQYPASARRPEAEARLKGLVQTALTTAPVRPPEPAPPAAGPCGAAATVSLASRAAAPLSAAEECSLRPKDKFSECAGCPEMVVVQAGSFTMGSPETELGRIDNEGPQHVVRIARPFAVGRIHVTVDQFAAFVRETGHDATSRCVIASAPSGPWRDPGFSQEASPPIANAPPASWRDPGFRQDGSHPAVCIGRSTAAAYAEWLAARTGRPYRLLSEAEWEYAARGRTQPGAYSRLWPGADESTLCRYGNGFDQQTLAALRPPRPTPGLRRILGTMPCNDGYTYTAPAGHYAPNAFGLHDMFGNARQWTADCWHPNYVGAPADGAAWSEPDRCIHVARGGAWNSIMQELRSASRRHNPVDNTTGLRVARTLAADAAPATEASHATGTDAAVGGAAVRGWAGIRIQTVTPELMRILGVREARGAAVVEARPDSPAARAGLESGDVIVTANGRDVSSAADFVQAIAALPPGATARLSVLRRGQQRTVSLTVGAQPEQR